MRMVIVTGPPEAQFKVGLLLFITRFSATLAYWLVQNPHTVYGFDHSERGFYSMSHIFLFFLNESERWSSNVLLWAEGEKSSTGGGKSPSRHRWFSRCTVITCQPLNSLQTFFNKFSLLATKKLKAVTKERCIASRNPRSVSSRVLNIL